MFCRKHDLKLLLGSLKVECDLTGHNTSFIYLVISIVGFHKSIWREEHIFIMLIIYSKDFGSNSSLFPAVLILSEVEWLEKQIKLPRPWMEESSGLRKSVGIFS